jgi:hypothetical protein
VRVLEDGVLEPGRHEVLWDGEDGAGGKVTSGVYFYVLETPGVLSRAEAKKMVIIH